MIRPHGNRVVVRPIVETTVASLFMPEAYRPKPSKGEVVAVSSKVQHINVGDAVVYTRYGGTEIVEGGQELIILAASDILAVATGCDG